MKEQNKNSAVKKDTEMKAWEEEYAKRIASSIKGWGWGHSGWGGYYPYDAGVLARITNLRLYNDLIHKYEVANHIENVVKPHHDYAKEVLAKSHEDLKSFREKRNDIVKEGKANFTKEQERIGSEGFTKVKN